MISEKSGILQRVRENPRTRRIILIGVIAAAILLIALWRYYAVRESTDDAQIDGDIIPISAKVGGTIIEVNVRENQYVKQGAVLIRIDPRDYQVAVNRANADLQEAQAEFLASQNQAAVASTGSTTALTTAQAGVQAAESQLKEAGSEVTVAQARLTGAQAKVREAESGYQKASKDVERLKPLVEKNEIAQRDYDTAVVTADSARAVLDSANAAVAEAEQGVMMAQNKVLQIRQSITQSEAGLTAARTAPEKTAAAQAQATSQGAKVEEKKAALEQAKLDLEHTMIRAPLNGWVSKKSAEPGQLLQAGQPIFSIVPLDEIWITANFKETQLKNMRSDQHAKISVDAYGGRKYEGHVESISPATGARFSLLPPENATGNYVKVVQRIPVKILFEKGQDPQHLLRPGMSVNVTVMTK